MGEYFNKTRGPIAVTLRGGSVASIPSKGWGVIAPEDEGTESLASFLRSGDLVGALVTAAPVVVPIVEVALVPEPVQPLVLATAVDAPAPVAIPLVVEAPVVAAEVEVVAADPSVPVESKSSRRNR